MSRVESGIAYLADRGWRKIVVERLNNEAWLVIATQRSPGSVVLVGYGRTLSDAMADAHDELLRRAPPGGE